MSWWKSDCTDMNRKDSKCQKLKPKLENKNYDTAGNELFFPKKDQKGPKMTKINFSKISKLITVQQRGAPPLHYTNHIIQAYFLKYQGLSSFV